MVIWLVVGILAAIGELVTYDLFLASVAAAAVVVAVLALVLPPVLQVTIFAGLSLAGIAFIRPALKGTLGIGRLASGADAGPRSRIAGRRGIITQPTDGAGGQIRIGRGEFWSARSFDPADSLVPGQPADVLLVEGLTALVEAVPPAPPQSTSGTPVTQTPTEKGIASCSVLKSFSVLSSSLF